jgi:hypothetical protein
VTSDTAAIPTQLREVRGWVVWRYDVRDGKPVKRPYRADRPWSPASSTDPRTWATYEQAVLAAEADGNAGIGFVLSPDDPFVGVDLDGCVNGDGVHEAVWQLVTQLGSYTEVTPSGTGLRVFVRGALPAWLPLNGKQTGRKTSRTPWADAFEVYSHGRFLTVTGQHLPGTPTTVEGADLDAICLEIFPPEQPPAAPRPRRAFSADGDDGDLIERARSARNGAKFSALWDGDTSAHGGDDSAADQALCNHLAFWTDYDAERVDRLFRSSGLFRPKWNRGDYRDRTISNALSGGPTMSTNPNPFTLATPAFTKNGDGPRNSGEKWRKGSEKDFPPLFATNPRDSLRFPRPLGENAYCGLAGSIVRRIEEHSEADPAAILATLLAMFGNAVGRGPYCLIGDAIHATNLYVCVVGETSSGRKGTSAEHIRRLLEAADPTWARCVVSGLVSGEGVIHHVRDARYTRRKPRKGEIADADGLVEELVDAGVEDKRMLGFIPEFSQVLAAIERKENSLSSILRDAWDRGTLQTAAKNTPDCATGALVSLLAHISPQELRARLNSTEIANGFANRFSLIASRRSQLLPRGGNVPPDVFASLVPAIGDALTHARALNEVDLTPDAWDLWGQHYERLSTPLPGLLGPVLGRAAPTVRRFSLIYALMGERSTIHREHLLAGLELWRYVAESARWVFGDRLGDRVADRCLAELRDADTDGLTRNKLRDLLGHRIGSEQTADALRLLEGAGLARYVIEPTAGRSRERWFATNNDPTEGK